MRHPTLKLISTHRLDSEKGRDLILWWLKAAPRSSGLWDLQYDIYGDGVLRAEVEELARLYPDQIIYHGYVTLQKVFEHSIDYDFVMMPSHFIETFGLSALDFAQFGVPTIGFQKGWLRQFVSDDLDIYQSPWETLQDKFNNLMDKISQELVTWDLKKYIIDKQEIKSIYWFQGWLEKFKLLVK